MKTPRYKQVKYFIKSVYQVLFHDLHLKELCEKEVCLKRVRDELSGILPILKVDDLTVVEQFISHLNELKEKLYQDANFILDSDPAAISLSEVVAIYPGFYAIFCYRVAHQLSGYNVPLLPRMIAEYAHRHTGIDIHPKAIIGTPFSIDHGTGIVIGETTEIGSGVKMYQGVTLGALSVDRTMISIKRHPTIMDKVILYSGCTVLGGETIIGENCIIGGNVWLTESVSPNSVVYHKSEVIVRNIQN